MVSKKASNVVKGKKKPAAKVSRQMRVWRGQMG